MNYTFKFLLSLILFFFSWSSAFAQYKLTDPVPVDPAVKVGRLSNGLTYYIRKNGYPEKKLELRLAINAGSILENDSQQGLAHFMEHMGFNGSKNFPKNELVDFLQKTGVQFGADLNAYTDFDETVYILSLPLDDTGIIEKGITVLEDWAFNNLLDKEEIEKERGIVLEESRLSKGSWERMSRQYYPKLMNGSKYAERLPIGKDEILKHFKYETLKDFYTSWYRPDLMAVIVVGDIDPADIEKKIIAHFGKFKNPVNAPARPAIIPIKQRTIPEALIVTDDEAIATSVEIYNYVNPATPIKTWAAYRENIIEGLVSTLISNRLSELTQQEDPPFTFANTSFSQFIRGYNTFSSYAALGQGNFQKAIDALIAETNRARKFGFLQTELDRSKAGMLNNAEKAFNEKDKLQSQQIIGQYVNNFLQSTAIPGVEHRYIFLQQIVSGITLSEVNAVAKKMPGTSNAFIMIQAPSSQKSQLPDNAGLLQALLAANKKTVTPYKEEAVVTRLMDKTPAPGKIESEKHNNKLGTTDLTLSNGITVTLKPTSYKNDEILLTAWRRGGSHKFDLADKQNVQFAPALVRQMGFSNLSPVAIRKFLTGKTIAVSPYIANHEEGIQGSSSVKDFETFLQIIYLYFTAPRKDPALFRSFITKQKASLQFLRQDPEIYFTDTVNQIFYNNNPWIDRYTRPEDLDKIDLEKTYTIYKHVFGNAYGMNFTFVGKLDDPGIKPLLEKYLGSLPAVQKENTVKDNGIRMINGPKSVVIKKGKESQSFISLRFEGETSGDWKESLKMNALLEVINIKITEKLREEMSGIYGGGLNGSIAIRPYVHYTISTTIPCGPENVNKVEDSLLAIIQNIQENGAEQKDLDKVKETLKNQSRTGLQNNRYWLRQLSTAWINRWDPEHILDFEEMVNSLTTKDMHEAARKYLDLTKVVKAVLYPENTTVPKESKKAF